MLEASQLDLIAQEISLPPVRIEEKYSRSGRISCRLKDEHSFEFTEQVSLPNRKSNPATAYESVDGVKLLVTTTPNDRKKPGYTGICLKNGMDERWLYREDTSELRDKLLGASPSTVRDEIRASWPNQFFFKNSTTSPDTLGLRPPQLGALHAIMAHWSLSNEPATVVMPTGTGKTETMLSLMVAENTTCILVIVPSQALRKQTADKFETLGILPRHGIVSDKARTPVVGIIDHQIASEAELEIFERCNVVVAVINSIASGTSIDHLKGIADRCSHLIFDEAHHVPASSWNRLKKAFSAKPVLQFTATPFREDRTPLGGKVIYNYPLRDAQEAGYFKPISFEGIFETDRKVADRRIAEKAIEKLRADLAEGWDHRLLARCQIISRAKEVFAIYKELADDLNPILVHSQEGNQDSNIEALKSGESKIVVTVNMLAEGFDLPELKVAAMHDTFKSLAITLQFTGRFPRVGSDKVGNPTIIANTGLDDVSTALQSLYDEDSNWDELLRDLAFEKIAERVRFEEFLHSARDLTDGEVSEDSIAAKLNKNSLSYRFNAIAYREVKLFNEFGIRNGLENNHRFVRAWQNNDGNVVFFVTRLVEKPKWTNNRRIEDSKLNLYVLYHDSAQELLYIGSTHKSLTGHQRLAEAVSGNKIRRFQDEEPYRLFAEIEHLVLQQVGLLSGGGARNIRYSMFNGADVADAINRIMTGQSTKSNIFGTGYRDGGPIAIGCSRKGKFWNRDVGSLSEWTEWCDAMGRRLLKTEYDTSKLLDNVLIPKAIEKLPNNKDPWYLEWPEKLNRFKETSVTLAYEGKEEPFHRWSIELENFDPTSNSYSFAVQLLDGAKAQSMFCLQILPKVASFKVDHLDGPELQLSLGSNSLALEEFFNEYPPILTFTEHSSLEGNHLVDPAFSAPTFLEEQCQVQDWSKANIREESRWKEKKMHNDSIQAQTMRWCVDEKFDIVFDDDGANEIADIVAIKEEDDALLVRLLHCKYSAEDTAGGRVKDIIEVTSQAVKNAHWFWSIERLADRMQKRHQDRNAEGAGRFFKGSPQDLKKLLRLHRISRKIRKEVFIVQPGISITKISPEMNAILGSADAFLRTRVGCPLHVWCSAS